MAEGFSESESASKNDNGESARASQAMLEEGPALPPTSNPSRSCRSEVVSFQTSVPPDRDGFRDAGGVNPYTTLADRNGATTRISSEQSTTTTEPNGAKTRVAGDGVNKAGNPLKDALSAITAHQLPARLLEENKELIKQGAHAVKATSDAVRTHIKEHPATAAVEAALGLPVLILDGALRPHLSSESQNSKSSKRK